MPILKALSALNKSEILINNKFMYRVYAGAKLVWQKQKKITTTEYGVLYNWYAATDARNIAAIGWHVSDHNTDLWNLATYLTGQSVGQNISNLSFKLKEIGTIYWESPNSDATNQVGFNGRGSGRRDATTGSFNSIMGSFSIITPNIYVNGPIVWLFSASTVWAFGESNYRSGNSIRLVKDSTTLLNGQSGTYLGNDGKLYRTICINEREWLADNLSETKYRNGDPIPEVTDNTAWANLTTGALCAYNNDWANVRTINFPALDYKTRVIADGGTVVNQTTTADKFNKLPNQATILRAWFTDSGVKFSGALYEVSKLYSLFGTTDFLQPTQTAQPELLSNILSFNGENQYITADITGYTSILIVAKRIGIDSDFQLFDHTVGIGEIFNNTLYIGSNAAIDGFFEIQVKSIIVLK